MLKYFYNLFCDLLYDFKNNKKIILCVLLFFIFGMMSGGLLKVKLCCYSWLFTNSFFNCFLFLFLYFAISTILTLVFLKSKKLSFLGLLLLFARGFCFCCTLKHVFLTFTFLKVVVIFLIFLVEECIFLFQICQILIYYCRHNISKYSIFNEFNCFLLICCVVFAFLITLLNFVFLRLLLGCA